jgi:hypothetical protein
MPDNWAYVLGAYGVGVLVFGAYWLRLRRRERELTVLAAGRRDRAAGADRDALRGGPPPACSASSHAGPASRSPRP